METHVNFCIKISLVRIIASSRVAAPVSQRMEEQWSIVSVFQCCTPSTVEHFGLLSSYHKQDPHSTVSSLDNRLNAGRGEQ